jgi:pseudo-rSAM protein
MEKYWFTLLPDTFLWIKHGNGLIYNSINQQQLSFELSEQIYKLCTDLLTTENLYTADLTAKDLENQEIRKWIDIVTTTGAGYLTMVEEGAKRPVSLKPILKIQDEVKHYVWKHNNGIGGDIIKHLHEITFYINGSIYGNCEYYKQCLFPVVSSTHLNVNTIRSFIKNSINPFLSNINLVGNIFDYSEQQQLFNVLEDVPISCTIHILFQDFLFHVAHLKNIRCPENIKFNIIVAHSINNPLLPLEELPFPVSFTLIIASLEEYEMLTNTMEDMDISTILFYNGNNIDFFETNIFLVQNDLACISLNKREIFIRQKMNVSDFGKLTVMQDGQIYANVNMPSLGTVNDTVYSLIYKEFTEGQSWFRIRNQFPCTDCIYQWLCPSPSNYEIVIGRPNLCHIVNK